MSRKKSLKWGETPWDKLTRAELLREVQRMYSAITSLKAALSLCNPERLTTGFWGTRGTGGIALEKARQIIEPIHAEYDQDDIYRSFFRYAPDLLFDCSTHNIGFGWVVCSKCGIMVGDTSAGVSFLGKSCSKTTYKNCSGTFRPLVWDDLRPKKKGKLKMTTLLDYLPETISEFKRHLAEDQSRWGDTWKQRPREGQEERAMARILDYFDQYRNAGVPIPWLKIMGEAHICLVRESHPDYGDTP